MRLIVWMFCERCVEETFLCFGQGMLGLTCFLAVFWDSANSREHEQDEYDYLLETSL